MGKFQVKNMGIEGLCVIEPTKFGDHRGYFLESYNQRDFVALGLRMQFVQDNESMSKKGVLRGLHFQKEHPQGKLVRVIQGAVFDVAVDIRKGSPTFGQWHGIVLSEENGKMFYIPEGFAHGFLVLSELAKFSYKTTDFYYPEDEAGIAWNDPDLGILWEGIQGEYRGKASSEGYTMADGTALQLSQKDQALPRLKDLVSLCKA